MSTCSFYAERHFDKFPDYASGGIIMASVDEVLHDFVKLVGYHNERCNQPVTDDRLAPKGQFKVKKKKKKENVVKNELLEDCFCELYLSEFLPVASCFVDISRVSICTGIPFVPLDVGHREQCFFLFLFCFG